MPFFSNDDNFGTDKYDDYKSLIINTAISQSNLSYVQ